MPIIVAGCASQPAPAETLATIVRPAQRQDAVAAGLDDVPSRTFCPGEGPGPRFCPWTGEWVEVTHWVVATTAGERLLVNAPSGYHIGLRVRLEPVGWPNAYFSAWGRDVAEGTIGRGATEVMVIWNPARRDLLP